KIWGTGSKACTRVGGLDAATRRLASPTLAPTSKNVAERRPSSRSTRPSVGSQACSPRQKTLTEMSRLSVSTRNECTVPGMPISNSRTTGIRTVSQGGSLRPKGRATVVTVRDTAGRDNMSQTTRRVRGSNLSLAIDRENLGRGAVIFPAEEVSHDLDARPCRRGAGRDRPVDRLAPGDLVARDHGHRLPRQPAPGGSPVRGGRGGLGSDRLAGGRRAVGGAGPQSRARQRGVHSQPVAVLDLRHHVDDGVDRAAGQARLVRSGPEQPGVGAPTNTCGAPQEPAPESLRPDHAHRRPPRPGAVDRRGGHGGTRGRPGVAESVERDLDVLAQLGQSVEARFSWAAEYRVMDLVGEFSDRLREELDFRVEARNATEIAGNLQPGGRVRIPRVHPDLSTSRVLVMEWLEG